jgi:hypothetical protein
MITATSLFSEAASSSAEEDRVPDPSCLVTAPPLTGVAARRSPWLRARSTPPWPPTAPPRARPGSRGRGGESCRRILAISVRPAPSWARLVSSLPSRSSSNSSRRTPGAASASAWDLLQPSSAPSERGWVRSVEHGVSEVPRLVSVFFFHLSVSQLALSVSASHLSSLISTTP